MTPSGPRAACRLRWRRQLEGFIQAQLDGLTGPSSELKIKITELIKLIELHGKMSDQKEGTPEFWKMIEKIRQQEFAAGESGRDRGEDEQTGSGEESP